MAKSGRLGSLITDHRTEHAPCGTFALQREAKAFETTMRTEVADKRHVVRSKIITLAEAGEEWLAAVAQGRGDNGPAEASTLRNYKLHLDRYIAPALGTKKLSDLAKTDVTAFRNDLLKRLSRAMAKKVLTSLKGILSEAVDQNRLTVNVGQGVQIGTGVRHKDEADLRRSAAASPRNPAS